MEQPSTVISSWYLSKVIVISDPGNATLISSNSSISIDIPLSPGQTISEYLVCYVQATNSAGQSSSLDIVPFTVSLPTLSPSPKPTLTPPAPIPPSPTTSCQGVQSGAAVPSWSDLSPKNLTQNWIQHSVLQVSWCPAYAVGGGPIIYTVTVGPGGYTCTTTAYSCVVTVPESFTTGNISLTATNQNGTSPSSIIYSNDGTLFDCSSDPAQCVNFSSGVSFPDYGNVSPTNLGDCTFAAVADWQQLIFNETANSTLLGYEFSDAGGSETYGLSISKLFNYWTNHGIAGHFLLRPDRYSTDEITLKKELDARYPLIAVLQLTSSSYLGNEPTLQGGHALVVSGYTPEGPIVVTWGETIQMTWQQWNSEATDMYALAVN